MLPLVVAGERVALLRTAAGHLVDAGYDVVETEMPDLTGTWKLWCDLIMTELSVLQEVQMRELVEQQRERERLLDAIRLSRATPRKTFSVAMARRRSVSAR
jgi:hypothetical protein